MKRIAGELALVLGAAAIPLAPTPLIPMVIAASLVLWIGGRGWADVGLGGGERPLAMVGLGVVIGAASIAALLLVDPNAVAANQPVAVRGSLEVALMVSILVAATAFAAEMTRGFVISRLIDLGCGPIVAVAIAAATWAAIFGWANPTGAIGLGAAAAGFGLLYLAGGKRMALPIAAHVTHEIGAVIASALGISG